MDDLCVVVTKVRASNWALEGSGGFEAQIRVNVGVSEWEGEVTLVRNKADPTRLEPFGDSPDMWADDPIQEALDTAREIGQSSALVDMIVAEVEATLE